MPAYHQMGHDSSNLLSEPSLEAFTGAILSPVNEPPSKMKQIVEKLKHRTNFEFVFDPQLYNPASTRGKLPEWHLTKSDLDTADQADENWWKSVVAEMVSVVTPTGANAICSPCVRPKAPSDDHLALAVKVGDRLHAALKNTGVSAIQTLVVNMRDISQKDRYKQIASVVTAAKCERVYIVFDSERDPRREYVEADELIGAMRLIQALDAAGLATIVSHASSEMILWKAAGAAICATGKFFNLRRYTHGRFVDADKGFGMVDYWFEEALLAFITQPDVLQIDKLDMFSGASNRNPMQDAIMRAIKLAPGAKGRKAWRAESWKQYLWWFADAERRIDGRRDLIAAMIGDAKVSWDALRASRIPMAQPDNDGRWIKPWAEALSLL